MQKFTSRLKIWTAGIFKYHNHDSGNFRVVFLVIKFIKYLKKLYIVFEIVFVLT